MTTAISVRDLVKVFGNAAHELRVLDKISFDVEEASLTTIVGPSGCGKSTILNLIAGIEAVTSGTVEISSSTGGSDLGYVFQNPRLLPWQSVRDNLMFVCPKNVNETTHKQRVQHYLDMVGLKHVKHKYPYQLSGGMQQRIGLARALCVEPSVLLMDEPFSHLDEITAETMRSELLRIWQKTHRTILFVTHDIQEAVQLGDRLIILNHARITADIAIDLPRPRQLTDPTFLDYYSHILHRFYQEIKTRNVEELPENEKNTI